MNNRRLALCVALASIANLGVVGTARADCRDPWVTAATMEYLHRGTPAPGDPECNIRLYNGGSWRSYAELQHFVATYWHATVYPHAAPAPHVVPPVPSPAPVLPGQPLAPPGSPSRQGFNFNVPACPVTADANSGTDKFSDGTPLPSCGGRLVQGNTITTFKLIWTGRIWAIYSPSMQTVTIAAPPHALGPQPQQPGLPAVPGAPANPGAQVSLPPLPGPMRLPEIPDLADALRDGLQMVDNLQTLAAAMSADSAGANAMWDAEWVNLFSQAIADARGVLVGPGPYSLKSIVDGTSVAFNEEERREFVIMLADSGFLDVLRKFDDSVVEAVSRAAPSAIEIVGSNGQPVRFAQDGALPYLTNIKQRINISGLDRAQRLVAVLSYSKGIKDAQVFMSGFMSYEQVMTNWMRDGIARVKLKLPAAITDQDVKSATGKLDVFLKSYTVVKFQLKLFTALLNGAAAILPGSISQFYMTIDNAPHTSAQAYHTMNVGQTADTHIWVVPHASGGAVITPLSIPGLLKDMGAGGPIMTAIENLSAKYGKAWVLRGGQLIAELLDRQSKANFNFYLSLYAKNFPKTMVGAFQTLVSIPPFNYQAIEINDWRVVRLPPDANGVVDVTYQNRLPFRYVITAKTPGQTGIQGDLQITDLYSGGGEKYFKIAIQVNGLPPPPSPPENWSCVMADGGLGVRDRGACVPPY